MLVTDGVPYTYENIFQEYNQPHKPVRVFTYLIGREISDLDAAKWMACENKGASAYLFWDKVSYAFISGYFTHVTTLAEVKEQVLKYIPVMARPLVLLREQHPIRWTGVYADIEVSNEYTKNWPTCQTLILPNFKSPFPTYRRRIEVTLAETWSLANTNELGSSSKTNLKFMQKQK